MRSDEMKMVIEEKMIASEEASMNEEERKKEKNKQLAKHYAPNGKPTNGVGQNNKTKPGSILKSIMELDDIVEQMDDRIEDIDYIKDVRLGQSRTKMSRVGQEEFECQLLRSAGSWAIGCPPSQKEQSIYNGYISLI
jgi:hypothetical protein